MSNITLRVATSGDIAFIMATERGPGYEPLVGRFAEDEHRAHLADDNWLYVIGLDGAGVPRGFAIFQDVKRDPAVRYLRRVAVAQAGAGFGRRLLSALIDWVFAATAAERVTLHVRKINTRAQHVYRSLGFVEDNSACEPDELAWMLPKSDWIAR